jgi:hypothetical protein
MLAYERMANLWKVQLSRTERVVPLAFAHHAGPSPTSGWERNLRVPRARQVLPYPASVALRSHIARLALLRVKARAE